jgi:hypothetical protein
MLHPGTATVGRPTLCHNQLPITLDCTLTSIELLTSCFADCDSMKKCEMTSNTAANATTKPAIAKSAPSSITPPPEFILKLTRSTNGRSIKTGKSGNCRAVETSGSSVASTDHDHAAESRSASRSFSSSECRPLVATHQGPHHRVWEREAPTMPSTGAMIGIPLAIVRRSGHCHGPSSHDEWEQVLTAGETLTHFGWDSLRHNRSRAAAQIYVADCTSWDALMASRPRKSAHLVDPRERTLIESKKPV